MLSLFVAVMSLPDATGPTGPVGPIVPATPEAAMELGQTAYAAINAGDYAVAIAPILMLLVWLFNAIFRGMIPRRFLPGCSVAAAVVAAVAFNLATMPPDVAWFVAVGKALALGLTVGPAASGLWSLVGKKLLAKKGDKPKDPPK